MGRQRARTTERYDTSQLRAHVHGRKIHRDYAAHFFRWGWATRFVGSDDKVLDVGCGQDLPLANILTLRIQTCPRLYVGVDQNLLPPCKIAWTRFHEHFDFVERWGELHEYGKFSRATCFEVIEHMNPEDGAKLLEGIYGLLEPGGKMLLSTPVFNGRAAAAHLHEYEIDELRAVIEAAGFRVEKRYGTFASMPDIRKVAAPAEIETMNRLREYYADDVAACFLAPMYPDASRNNAWLCVKPS